MRLYLIFILVSILPSIGIAQKIPKKVEQIDSVRFYAYADRFEYLDQLDLDSRYINSNNSTLDMPFSFYKKVINKVSARTYGFGKIMRQKPFKYSYFRHYLITRGTFRGNRKGGIIFILLNMNTLRIICLIHGK